jgi:DNA-binding NarL/FixJ family response regulator
MTPCILIVDDQREVSRLLRSALETIEHGLDVVEAPSGEEAILEASRRKIDLLVADFRLPGITGVELTRKMQARNPAMKVILITGVTDPKVREDISKAGADAYFTKPVPMADFLDAVERTLGLVRTILPSSPTVLKDKERKGLADLLAGLRKQMNAQAVVLLNDRGHIKVQAGDLPESNMEVSLISALMAIHSAAHKVSSLVGHNASGNIHFFRSEVTDMIFAPIGPQHALLMAGRNIAAPEKWAANFKAMNESLAEIHKVLEKMGVTGSLSPEGVDEYETLKIPQENSAVEAQAVEIQGDFDELLKQATQKPKTDADAFWDQAVEKGATFVLKDTLSFEEASKLGLTPDHAD